jgi:hypothetical protein
MPYVTVGREECEQCGVHYPVGTGARCARCARMSCSAHFRFTMQLRMLAGVGRTLCRMCEEIETEARPPR